MNIDMIIINEKFCKCNARIMCHLRKKIERVSKDMNMSTSDSKDHELTKNDHLPGGTLTSTFEKSSSHVIELKKITS